MNRKGGRGNGCGSFFVLIALVAAAAAADVAAAQDGPPSGRGPNYFNPQNFNPSMAVIIVVLVTAFFFLGFFSIYIRRCAGGPLGGPGEYLGGGGGRPGGITILTASGAARSRRMRGLDLATLEAFPTMAYADVKAHKAGKGALECAVCLSEFEDDDTLRLLTRCSHAFHADCIDAWLASHVTCPVCRANLLAHAEAPAAAHSAAAASTGPEQDVLAATPPQETPTAPPEQVTVAIADAEETEEERVRREEAAELVRIRSVKRALRSKSGRSPAQFPRSHTTGHSLAAPADRYTLRLPDHVLQEVVAAGKLRRTRSLTAFREGGVGVDGSCSTRRGFGGGRAGRSVRLGHSGRWPNMSFFSRSLTFSAWGSMRRGEADAAGKGSKVAVGDGEDDGKAVGQQCEGGACQLPLGGRV